MTCSPCPAGQTCQNTWREIQQRPLPDDSLPMDCPAGWYADTLDWYCQPCPPGQYCPGGGVDGDGNRLGAAPIPCAGGTYASALASATCTNCPTGYFSLEAAEVCTPVPGGWGGTGDSFNSGIEPCASATYSDDGQAACATCPDGFLCPPLTSEATPWVQSCPRGSYCVGGVQTLCPAGNYGTVERAGQPARSQPIPSVFRCSSFLE